MMMAAAVAKASPRRSSMLTLSTCPACPRPMMLAGIGASGASKGRSPIDSCRQSVGARQSMPAGHSWRVTSRSATNDYCVARPCIRASLATMPPGLWIDNPGCCVGEFGVIAAVEIGRLVGGD
jgi:hypothetical protein